MQNKNILNSPRLLELKNKRRKHFFGKILLYVFFSLVVFAALVYVSRNDALNISHAEIIGNKVIEAEAIKNAVQAELAGNYFWLFPKTNIFIYPKKNIKNKLLNEFDRLKDVQFSVKDRKNLKISVTERTPLYTWCGETPPKNAGDKPKCYFLDDTGYIFDEAAYFSGDVYFRFYGPNWKEVNFQKLILFKKTFEDIRLSPVALYLEKNGDVRIFLSARDSRSFGPEIIFRIDSDFKKIIGNLETALATEPLLSDFKKKYSSLECIDLRFGNKVYFRFR